MLVGREVLFWIFFLGKMGAYVIFRVVLFLVMYVFFYDLYYWRLFFRFEMLLEITKFKVLVDGCLFSF